MTNHQPSCGPTGWRIIENKLVIEATGTVSDTTVGLNPLLDVESSGKFRISPQSSAPLSAEGTSFYTPNTGVSELIIEGGTYTVHHDPGIGSVKVVITAEGAMALRPRSGAAAQTAVHGFVLRPGETHIVDVADGTRVLIIETTTDILEEYAGGTVGPGPITFDALHTLSEPILAFGAALARQHTAQPLTNYFIDQFLEEMVISILLSAGSFHASAPRGRAGVYSRAQDLINGRYLDPSFTVAELATLLKMSVRNLQDIYAQHGKNASQAIRTRRLQEAKRLLADPVCIDLTIEQVAIHSGLENVQRLRRAFEAAGLPNPRTFRAQSMRTNNIPD